MKRSAAIGLVLLPAAAAADVPAAPPQGWTEGWSLQPWLLLPLGLTAVLHATGTARLWRRSRRGRAVLARRSCAFAAAWLTLAAAIVSPLDAWAGLLFSVHMVQHLVIMLLAAPLLVMSRPMAALLHGLPARLRRHAARLLGRRPVRAVLRWVALPLPALALHAGLVWLWHAPVLYEAALSSQGLHALEHASFVLGGVAFFMALPSGAIDLAGTGSTRNAPRGIGCGGGVLLVFVAAAQATVLGALITFAPQPLYATHAAGAVALGIHPLEDQQLAGVLMWVPANVVYVLLALALVRGWLDESERRSLLAETAPAPDRDRRER